jgi:hypothetical protein
MKFNASFLAGCTVALALLSSFSISQAQQGPVKVDVGKIIVTTPFTPRLSTDGKENSKRDDQKVWLEVEVEFKADMKGDDDYLNTLSFDYFIYFNVAAKDGQRKLYTTTVNHINVPKGEDMFSVVYVSPTSLGKIFGKDKRITSSDVWVAVEVKSNGALVGGDANEGKSKKWWQSQNVARVTDLLLNKNQTPFAPLWWDRYPEIEAKR